MSLAAIEWAYRQRLPGPGVKATLVALANFADESGSCYPGRERLAEMTSQGPRTVSRHVAELERLGLVRVERRTRREGRGRTTNRYHLNLSDTTAPRTPDLSDNAADRSATNVPSTTDLSATVTDLSATVSRQEPSLEPSEEPSVKPRRDSQASHDPVVSAEVRDLCNLFVAEHCKPNGHGVPSKNTKASKTWLVEMDRLTRIGPPNTDQPAPVDRIRDVIAFMATHRGNGSFPGWSAVVESVPKFRVQFTKIAAAMEAEARNGHHGRSPPSVHRVSDFGDDSQTGSFTP